jgi:Fuc2NAc and GlcNAc transferase
MDFSILLLAVATMLLSMLGVWAVRYVALRRGIIDLPNARSSHVRPTPRGGGVAIVGASELAFAGLYFGGWLDKALFISLSVGGLMIAWVGFMDDLRSQSVLVRFFVHLTAAIVGIAALGGVPPIQIGSYILESGPIAWALAIVTIIWALNLYNFMDGIDGIATCEAVFVLSSGVALSLLRSSFDASSAAALVVAAAALGFLFWNWPPAKIFMGDVGSGFLGYVVAILALASANENSVMPVVWLILGGVFFVDATVTLTRRLMRGDKVYQAHRAHAYQWLARRWQSHLRVTLLTIAINVLWLLPMAWWCVQRPELSVLIVGIALAPLVGLALLAGAGRQE